MADDPRTAETNHELPPYRYTAALAAQIEQRWQQRWAERGTFDAPNPTGALAEGFDAVADRPKFYALDMFPYPSGAGLHVGHPLGYIGTDTYARYKRMTGHNVLHTMGYDAFGLPAEQYAIDTGQHPRVTTEANIANMSRQLGRLGLGYDTRRTLATTDTDYYRWTQWIFLQLFEAYYDERADRARPITELISELDAGIRAPDEGTLPAGADWASLDDTARRLVIDAHRLAYVTEAPVNWCPGLGTVLANEEVNAEGRSERGNFPVHRRPLRQWMLRITAYAERLLADLDLLDWPEPIKLMQRNWIGRSTGATVEFTSDRGAPPIEVFTTRPDTLFGATYVVLAPEHELVDAYTAISWPDGTPAEWTNGASDPARAVADYQEATSRRSDRERQAETREKTGVFTGSFALNPVNGDPVPVFIADYVLTGYGTGAIMAVPAHDERDFAFAKAFGLGITEVVHPPSSWFDAHDLADGTPVDGWPDAFTGDGVAVNSANDDVSLDGLGVDDAKAAITGWLGVEGTGRVTVTYKLRDWLFSRQRYWGEPFPIVWDDDGFAHAIPADQLPVLLPEVDDFSPEEVDDDSVPAPPLGRAVDWVEVTLDLGDGPRPTGARPTRCPNGPVRVGTSCGTWIRRTTTRSSTRPSSGTGWVRPRRASSGGVDLYVGGVEHAVLHLLYARFWHKVLYDLGHVSSLEPFHRLFNQGYVQAFAYIDERGFYVPADEVVETAEGTLHLPGQTGDPRVREDGQEPEELGHPR